MRKARREAGFRRFPPSCFAIAFAGLATGARDGSEPLWPKRGLNEPSGDYREVRELPSRLAEQSIEVGAVVALGSLLELGIDIHRHR